MPQVSLTHPLSSAALASYRASTFYTQQVIIPLHSRPSVTTICQSIQFSSYQDLSSKTDVSIPRGSKISAAFHAELYILNTLLQVNLQFSWIQSLESDKSLGCFLVLVNSHFFFYRTGE